MAEIPSVTVQDFVSKYNADKSIKILDVRKPGEWETTHLVSAHHLPLDFINDHMSEINHSDTFYTHCRSGHRSTIAASILYARGFKNLVNVIVAFDDIKNSGMPVEGSCPSLIK